jgi:4-hydroxybenzoate polyprenyltransferase
LEVVEMSGMLNFLWGLCLGAVALFGFFAVIGGFAPGDVLWLTLVVAFLGLMFAIHQMHVGHELSEHGNDPMVRQVQRIRERRGF